MERLQKKEKKRERMLKRGHFPKATVGSETEKNEFGVHPLL